MQWMDCFISQIKSDKTTQLQEEVMVTRQASWINNLVSRTGALMIKRPADTALLSVASARSRNSLCVCPRMAVAWMTGASLLQQCWSLPLTVTIFGRVWYTAITIQVCFRNGVKNNCIFTEFIQVILLLHFCRIKGKQFISGEFLYGCSLLLDFILFGCVLFAL